MKYEKFIASLTQSCTIFPRFGLAPASLSSLAQSAEKIQNLFGEQLAQTFRTQESAEVLYLFSVVFCAEPYGHYRKQVQTLCTLSVIHSLYIFCDKARIFSSVRV